MIERFIKRKVTTSMIFLGICLLGIISLKKLPVQLLPDIEFPKLTIVTPYENAAPAEIEKLVTKYIEEAASSVSGLVSLYSESLEGVSIVTAQFQWGTNMDIALIETKEKVDVIKGQLPQDTGKSIVVKFDPNADPIMIYTIVNKTGDFRDLRKRVEKEMLPYIERIEGVAMADINGGYKRQINIDLDCAKIYAHSLSLSEVIENVNTANYSFPAGNIEKGDMEYSVRTIGEFSSINDMKRVVVGRSEAGVPVYLDNIGALNDGYKDRKCIIRLNGREAVGLLIQKEPGKNTIETCGRIEERMKSLREKYKNDFEIKKIYNLSTFIQNSVDNVAGSAVIGGIIAFFVLWFFLKEPRSSLIIALTMPVSIIGTFGLMYFKNISLNSMSLGGLAIGVGMMVDASIVVLDSIVEKQSGLPQGSGQGDKIRAALEGISEVKTAVVASVITTFIVFLPVIYLSGITGAMFGELALTITFSLICSLFTSLTLIPMLSTLSIRPVSNKWLSFPFLRKIESLAFSASDRFMALSINIYNRMIRFAFDNRKLVFLSGVSVIIAGMLLFLLIDKELMPKVDPGEFSIEITAPKGTSLEESSLISSGIESLLLQKPYVDFVYAKTGSDPEDNITERISGRFSNYSIIKVILKQKRSMSAQDIIAALKKEIRLSDQVKIDYEVRQDVVEAVLSKRSKPLMIEIYGKDMDGLKALGDSIKEKLILIKGVYNAESVLDTGSPELKINVDRNKMASLGVNIADAASSIRAAIYGEVATRFRERDDEIDVRVRLNKEDRTEKESLNKILVKSDTGATIPVSKFISIEEGFGTSKIIRSEQSRVNFLTADISGNKDRVFRETGDMISAFKFPEGYEAKITGEKNEIEKALPEMLFIFVLAIVLVYMDIAAEFQSFASPLIVMLTIPMMTIGISGALLLTGKTLNINSGIGIVLLVGVVVDNAIVLLDFMEMEMARGKGLKEAIVDAGTRRLRPIFMVTGSTIVGMIPLALGIGEGAELQQSMAIVTIGGLAVSTFLTLVFIPTIYLMTHGKKHGHSWDKGNPPNPLYKGDCVKIAR